MKSKKFLSGILVMMLLAIMIFACKKYNNNYNNSNGNSPTIHMKNDAFSAGNVTVSTGSNVMWVNDDTKVHTVTADDGSFNSGDIQPGNSYNFTFKSTGTYAYHDAHNSSMTGMVTVVSTSSGGY